MSVAEKSELKNGVKVLVKKNNNTPRVAVVLYSRLSSDDKIPGIGYLMSRLMLKGTDKYTAEELADFLDENAIDLTVEKKADYIRAKLLCLNEDAEKGLEVMSDIIFNSTFETFDKEVAKIKGEFEADLDSPRVSAQDEYYATVFKNHPYGVGRKEILKNIDKITKDDIFAVYEQFKNETVKNISYAGDFSAETMLPLFEKYFGNLKMKETGNERKKVEAITENRVSVIRKEDANQAQIFQGRIFPPIWSDKYPKIVLLNTILGSSGLSSRLFLELREKQGLAYTVRSVYEPYVQGGDFFVYIATEPSNIKKSLDGFKIELDKIMTEEVGEEELTNAKNNAIGKRRFYKETNMSESALNGYYECIGLGYEFEDKLIEQIQNVTKEELKATAAEFFAAPSALCILAPEKYLKEAALI